MALTVSFALCIAFNLWLIWICLSRPILLHGMQLRTSLRQSRRYLACKLTEKRERALRQRTLALLRQVTIMLGYLAVAILMYIPSVLFAYLTFDIAAAFYSLEALIGSLGALAVIVLARDSA